MVQLRGKVYYVDMIVAGRRVHKSTGCRDKDAAEAVAERMRKDAEQSAAKCGAERITMRDAVEDLFKVRWEKTADGEQVYARMLKVVDILGNKDLRAITAADVASLRVKLSEGRSSTTVNRFLAPLKTLLRVACDEWEVLDKVPRIPMESERNHRERVMSAEEEVRIVASLRDRGRGHVADMVEVMLDTAIRPKELKNLTDDMVDMAERVLRLPGNITKNHRPRVVPMTDRVHRIFGSRLGNGRAFPISKWVLAREFKLAKEAVGIMDPDLVPYICRHTAITRLLERGNDIYLVGQIAGHTTSGMTERYGHLCLDAKRGAIETINGKGVGQPVPSVRSGSRSSGHGPGPEGHFFCP